MNSPIANLTLCFHNVLNVYVKSNSVLYANFKFMHHSGYPASFENTMNNAG